MHEPADATHCLQQQVEESLNRFLGLFAIDCVLWPPALERVEADLEAMHEAWQPNGEAPPRQRPSQQRRVYLDD